MASQNHNPTGKNQHGEVLKSSDSCLVEALERYHREKKTNNKVISELLRVEYGIEMSDTTVKHRRKELGLYGSRTTIKTMSHEEAEQLVIDELSRDTSKHSGVKKIQHKVLTTPSLCATEAETIIQKHVVSDIMHTYDAEGFDRRELTSKRILRAPKYPIGIHERWAADGHDKLYKIGFPIWAVVDDATGKSLGGWVVPSNRMGYIVAYCFLCLIETYGGIPIQLTTDHGSETTQMYGLMNAVTHIFTIFWPEFDTNELPAHVYLRSVHNISIERSWLHLRLDMGDNAVAAFEKGAEEHGYNDQNPQHYQLCQWLWPVLLRQELKKAMEFRNTLPIRKQKNKPGPSGMSRNDAFTLPDKWGGRNCLLPVDMHIIRDIKEAMGGDDILEFVSRDFRKCAEHVYASLNIAQLGFDNVWFVFNAMLPLVFPQ
ncbi:hypothetical protein BC835DRAFT_1269742 [Cytidiella melzeri]|nr:hypothetical protein BC835DRAFT_1269742 [Cytidiella melzeri]